MGKVIVTLRSAPPESVEVPKYVKGKKGKGGEPVETERSCFGALRFFPGIPKTVTADELEYVKSSDAELARRLAVRPYVESKRVDRRGATEAEVEALAETEGVGHLGLGRKVEVLRRRGKLKVKPTEPPKPKAEVKTTRRKNGNGK